jgi:GT2 family glycosyltransferase
MKPSDRARASKTPGVGVPSDGVPARRGDHAPAQTQDILLSVIIAHYNGRDLLAGCLKSIFENPPRCSFEVIVVDDASSDGSADMVRAAFPGVILLCNETNVHYGESNNRALRLARGRVVYLLNNDTLVLPGAMDSMIEFLDRHPTVGAVGSKLLNGDGTIQASVKTLPCVMSAFFGARSILTTLFPANRFSRGHLLHLSRDMTRPFEAGYVSSASTMIRREVIEQVGDLDARLSYHVDADYCKRIWDAGWIVTYLPTATVVHFNHKGGTMATRRRRFMSLWEFHRGTYIYFQKHQRMLYGFPVRVAIIMGLGLRFLVSTSLQVIKEIAYATAVRPLHRRR